MVLINKSWTKEFDIRDFDSHLPLTRAVILIEEGQLWLLGGDLLYAFSTLGPWCPRPMKFKAKQMPSTSTIKYMCLYSKLNFVSLNDIIRDSEV